MSFKSFNDYLFENENINYVDITVHDAYCRGEFKYREYDDGIIVDLGGWVDNQYRNAGVFKCLFVDFLSRMKEGNIVYLVSTNPILNKFLEKYGFTKTNETVRYWGNPENGVIYKKIF